MLIDIHMKFREDSLSGFKLNSGHKNIETQFGDVQSSKGNNSTNSNAGFTVLALCTPSIRSFMMIALVVFNL